MDHWGRSFGERNNCRTLDIVQRGGGGQGFAETFWGLNFINNAGMFSNSKGQNTYMIFIDVFNKYLGTLNINNNTNFVC